MEETIKKKKNVNIKKETALKNVEGLLNRIKELNEDDSFIHFINQASLFGSILTDKEKLGDIDVFLDFKRRNDDYCYYLDLLEDRRKITTKLRHGKKSFSFHWMYELESFLEENKDFKYKKIYEYGD